LVAPETRILRPKGRSYALKSRAVHLETRDVPLSRCNVEDDGFIVLDAG